MVWDQLKPLDNFATKLDSYDKGFEIKDITRGEGEDVYRYEIQYEPF